jgi:hypothetical protein
VYPGDELLQNKEHPEGIPSFFQTVKAEKHRNIRWQAHSG